MNLTDRRVRRTQKALGDALIALALEKEYDEITIQEITERADIGYRTFFRHYSDKDELLKDVLKSVRIEMRGLMSPPSIEQFLDPDVNIADLPSGAMLFKHVQENCDLYQVLLFSDRGLVRPMKTFAIQEFTKHSGNLIDNDIPLEILANHMISAIINLLRWWLENDMCHTPEEMGDYASRMIILPTRELIIGGYPNDQESSQS
jgi:AcrR family transcriptional regulator